MTPLEEDGQALLLRDLLRLQRTFRFRRYRIDLIGFLVAWVMVAGFIAFYVWMSTW